MIERREEIAAALGSAALSRVLVDQGAEPGGDPPEHSAAFVRSESERWGEVVRRAGVKPD